ncbi:MAG: molybdate ABC transporter permease subunit [Nitrospirota bacterium]
MFNVVEFSPLLLTFKVAGLATCISLIAGTAVAYMLSRNAFPGRDWLDAFLMLPIVLPPTVLGYYIIVVVGRNGFIGRWLEHYLGISLMFTWQGAVIAASIVSLPMVVKSARAAFEGVSPDFENAARTLGQSETSVFFRVTLPLAWRGILSGAMLAFARAMGEFGATLMVAGDLPGRTQTLSLAIYDAVQAGNDSLGMQLVILTSVICMTMLVLSGKLLRTEY